MPLRGGARPCRVEGVAGPGHLFRPARYRRLVPPTTPAQHALDLPDGRQVERMPLGYAAGHWWLSFVISGQGNWLRGTFGNEEFVRFDIPEGNWEEPLISAGGVDNPLHLSGDVLHVTCEFGRMPWIEVEYLYQGLTFDTERLVIPEVPA